MLFNTGAFPPPHISAHPPVSHSRTGPLVYRRLNLFWPAALWMAVAKHERMTPDVRAGFGRMRQLGTPRRDRSLRAGHPRLTSPHVAGAADIERDLATFADRPCQLIWACAIGVFVPRASSDWCRFFLLRKSTACPTPRTTSWKVDQQIVPRMERFLERGLE